MKRLACLMVVLVIGGACSGSSGTEPATPAQGGAPAAQPSDAAPPPANPAAAQPAMPMAGQPATPAAAAAPSGSPAAPPQPAAPQFREVSIPAGTALSLTLETAVASNTSKVEDTVRARLAAPIIVGGTTVAPKGAEVIGTVLEAEQSGRVKGRASLAIGFNRLRVRDETHNIRTARIAREAEATKGEDAKKVGIGAGAGALVGALAGGKKGALVGGAVGAGAGTGVVLATRGEEVELPAGTALSTTLEAPITIQVPIK